MSSSSQPSSSFLAGRVLRSQSGQFWVDTSEGIIHCRLRGRMKRGKARTDLVVIGDRVRLSLLDEEGEGIIEEVEPRTNRFSRRQPGPRGRFKEHVIVANLDWILAVFACDNPPMNPRLLDRFLVIAEHNDVPAAIVANKVDLIGHDAAKALFGPYEALGYPVLYTSTKTELGLDALRVHLRDNLSAVVGASGVGKSSLLNALQPTLRLAVKSVSDLLGKGRHTTRVAEIFPLDGGGWIADTPGIRELGSFALEKPALARCFPEFRPYLGMCGFANCLHDSEPRCAVRDAVEAGKISAERYESYLRQLHDEER